MQFIERIKNLITLDESSSTETTRTSIIIRTQSVILIAYTLFLFSPFLSSCEWQSLLVGLSFLGVYLIILLFTYYGNTAFSKLLLCFVFVLQSAYIQMLYGIGSGAQYFIISSMVIAYLTFYMDVRDKIVISIGYAVIFIVFEIWFSDQVPVFENAHKMYMHVQTLTGVTIILSCVTAMLGFSGDAMKSEKRLMEYNREILESASVDPLTKLLNRRAATGLLEKMVEDYNKGNLQFTICIGDIDFFKKINDTYGHNTGDVVLVDVARILKAQIGNGGFVARWGGEEFLLVIPHNLDNAMLIVENIRKSILYHFIETDECVIKVTMTFGLAEYSSSDSINHTLELADERLYYGKEHGRNRVSF